MNGVGERRHLRPALIGPSLRGREKETETETETETESDQTGEVAGRGVQQSLAMFSFLP